MGSKRPTICLSMIVKNESAVIRRCLRSVKPFLTSWSISDTGSTDGTQAIIREEMAGIPGELIERPWVDFSTNRNEALALARKSGARYLLVIDADEELLPDAGFTLEDLDADTYSATFNIAGTEARWFRKLLLKASLPLSYVGAMDEAIDDAGLDNRVIENCIVKSYIEGARSRDGLLVKFQRDIETLRGATEREPENPRNWFYLGQRLGGAERYEEGIAAYERRLALPGGFEEERFASILQIAHYKLALERPFAEVVAAYEAAFDERPTRAEPLLQLAMIHADAGKFGRAELYARAAARLPRPSDSLLVNDSVYAWAANDTLAGIWAATGKLQQARELLEKLLALPQCPETEHTRIRENVALIRAGEGAGSDEPTVTLGPDELIYAEQADSVRRFGFRNGLRKSARRFIQTPAKQALPSPVRWLWILAVSRFGQGATLFPAIACVPLLAWAMAPFLGADLALGAALLASLSPLLWQLGRRRLQDSAVAFATLATIGFAAHGSALGVALMGAALLGLKDAALASLPAALVAWTLSGHQLIGGAVAVSAAVAIWALVILAVFGRMAAPMLRKAAAGHATPYTLTQQRGQAHRPLVDLALVSPLPVAFALLGTVDHPALAATTLALLVAHALAPVRNVRLVLAAELLIRALATATLARFGILGIWASATAMVAADILVGVRVREIYDPTTAELAGALGMTRQSA